MAIEIKPEKMPQNHKKKSFPLMSQRRRNYFDTIVTTRLSPKTSYERVTEVARDVPSVKFVKLLE